MPRARLEPSSVDLCLRTMLGGFDPARAHLRHAPAARIHTAHTHTHTHTHTLVYTCTRRAHTKAAAAGARRRGRCQEADEEGLSAAGPTRPTSRQRASEPARAAFFRKQNDVAAHTTVAAAIRLALAVARSWCVDNLLDDVVGNGKAGAEGVVAEARMRRLPSLLQFDYRSITYRHGYTRACNRRER